MKEEIPQRGASAGLERKQFYAWFDIIGTLKDSSRRRTFQYALLTVLVLSLWQWRCRRGSMSCWIMYAGDGRFWKVPPKLPIHLRTLSKGQELLLRQQLNQDSRFGQVQPFPSKPCRSSVIFLAGAMCWTTSTATRCQRSSLRPLMANTAPGRYGAMVSMINAAYRMWESVQLDMQWFPRLTRSTIS